MKSVVAANIVLGQPLPFSIFDRDGRLLLRQGVVITMPDQVDRLIARGALLDESEAAVRPFIEPTPGPGTATEEQQPAFERLGGLILNLKHIIGTALKHPDQIDVTMRIGKIATVLQDICTRDSAGALAAPCLDHRTPYIVVHQMMGAVLTEIMARSTGLAVGERHSLVCAALTRDLGQVPLQSQLDTLSGALPDTLRLRMFQHPRESAELLQRCGVSDPLWIDAVRGHHERLDGSGYPGGLQGDAISQGARMLAIADIYSAMAKPRPYRSKAYFPQHALKDIYMRKEIELDSSLAQLLISQIGLLPPGTMVKLQCGEVAVIRDPTVKAENAIVFSVMSKTGMPLAEPIERRTTQPGFAIAGLLPYSECRSAAVTIKRVWTG